MMGKTVLGALVQHFGVTVMDSNLLHFPGRLVLKCSKKKTKQKNNQNNTTVLDTAHKACSLLNWFEKMLFTPSTAHGL